MCTPAAVLSWGSMLCRWHTMLWEWQLLCCQRRLLSWRLLQPGKCLLWQRFVWFAWQQMRRWHRPGPTDSHLPSRAGGDRRRQEGARRDRERGLQGRRLGRRAPGEAGAAATADTEATTATAATAAAAAAASEVKIPSATPHQRCPVLPSKLASKDN